MEQIKSKMKKLTTWRRTLLLFTLVTTMFFGGCIETDFVNENTQNAQKLITANNDDYSITTNETEYSDTTVINAFNIETSTTDEEITTLPSNVQPELSVPTFSLSDIPAYTGNPYIVINDNNPYFLDDELATTSFELYSELDSLGRCGVAYSSVGIDIMPTEERGSIGSVKPTGWHTVKYDVVDGKYLYNRCHLLGYQLTGENANVQNLITGTRYLNVDGMLPFENMVADYVKETNNHVQYRVTPIFESDNLLASGVLMEAKSVEDNGEGICFSVYCYNVQPGISIDYTSGESWLADSNISNVNESNTSNKDINKASPAINDSNNSITNNASSPDNTKSNEPEKQVDNNTPNDSSGSNGSSGTMVWKSATGSKYHSKNNCGNMNPSKASQITLEQAEAQGLGRCSKCW